MKKGLIVGLVILVLAAAGGGVWYFFLRDKSSQASQDTANVDKSAPVPYKSSDDITYEEYSSTYNPNLKVRYPSDWIVAEGEDNSADLQIITFESGQDLNEFYFCMNFDEYAADDMSHLTIPDVEIVSVEPFATEGIPSGLSLVTFKSTKAPNDYQLALTDTPPAMDATIFTAQVTSAGGRRVQIWGRFNCREAARPSFSLDQFNNSQLVHDATGVLKSLQY